MKDSVAIVGMACRLPGADGLDAFWKLLVDGGTAWGVLPAERFSRELYFEPGVRGKTGKSYSELGAVVSNRPVDPAVCPITPDLLDRYDVAHHVFLEVASQACRDAGMDPFAMPADRRTGVYVGHTGGSTKIGDIVYSSRIDEASSLLEEVATATTTLGSDARRVAAEVTDSIRRRHPGRKPDHEVDLVALGAARIVQEALDLEGPYLVVDAACASSLQALAIAVRALLQGGIDQAIVGGASYCKSDSLVLFSAAQSVSNTGSYPFGRDADGLVTAEGYVALVIKTLSRAMADGDRIHGVIRGLGVASDGKGKSLWAPRQEGQRLAVERAYPCRDDLARLDYIEAHATSTQVGDATELGALASLLNEHLPAGRQIPIGSVKANIGHTLETAGLASLVKVLLAMRHGIIPPGSTATELNDSFDWATGPFQVPRAAIPWPRRPDGSPRLAAVNAFGIGGLNVHVALTEHVPAPATAVPSPRPLAADAEPIAIVGAGAVLPGSLSLDAFFSRIDRAESAVVPVPADRWDVSRALDPAGPRPWHTVAAKGGFVQGFAYDWRRHKVPPKQIAAANPLQFMLLEAADAALADAGGARAGLDRTRTGVIVGTMFGGEFANDLQIGLRLPETATHLRAALRRRGIAEAEIDAIVVAYERKVLERLPALIDETGSFTSSTLASRLTKSFDFMGGALAIDAGDCSSLSAIAAAVDMLREGTCDAVVCAAGQRAMDLVAFEGMSLDGLLASEPQSVLGSRSRGRVPAEGAVVLVLKRLSDARAAGNRIRGVIRGATVTAASSAARAAVRAVSEAGATAGLSTVAVRALEMVGTGSVDGDGAEIAALAEAYGHGPVAGALQGLVGHLGAAAGAAGIVKLARALEQGQMPGTAGLAEDRPRCEAVSASAGSLTIAAVDASGYRAGAITASHGNLVGHAVIDNGLPVPPSARPFAATPATKVVVASPAAVRPPRAQERPLVAALFPGQGSQYSNMFRGLVEESAVARDCLAGLDALAKQSGLETLAEIAWRPDNGLGTRVWDTQWGMYLADLLAWKTLRAMGFAPDVVASHSFGEFPSLAAVDAWSFADGARATRARAEAVQQFGPRDGAMLSVIADRPTVTAALAPFADHVWVCAENAPEQFVVGGTARAVDAVELILEGQRIRSKRLAVPSPFHTPLLSSAAARLAESIGSLAISAPTIPTYSSTTVSLLADAASVTQSLVRQMTEMVRWVSVVERLHEAGVRVFVEVGPSGVLTGLVRRILEGKDVTVLQFDQRGRDPARHVAGIVEQLRTIGAVTTPVVDQPCRRGGGAGRVTSFDATERRRARNRAEGARLQPVATNGSNGHRDQPRNGSNGHRDRATNGSNGHPDRATNGLERRSERGVVIEPAVPTNRITAYESPAHGGATASRMEPRRSGPAVPAAAVSDPLPAGHGDQPRGEGRDLETALVDFVVEQTGYPPEIVELDADLEADLGIDSIRKAQLFGEIGQRYGLAVDDSVSLDDFRTLRHVLEYMGPRVGGAAVHSGNGRPVVPDPVPSQASASRPVASTIGTSATANGSVATESPDAALESFLVDFVVEQTGYPREIVELDADLEADLGIDSIRKAQLFGEIGQKYGLSADDSVSLDDFRTLRHLFDYMLPRVGVGSGSRATPLPATSAAATAKAAAKHETNGHAVTMTATVVAEPDVDGRELEPFLVDFVVEQTGYPREIVELDADLEADLGIDSIRKAQLFGEIGQKYGLSADDGVSLDDFRTLRHLVDYMRPRLGGEAAGGEAPTRENPAAAPAGRQRGRAFDRGVEEGRREREAIRRWARQSTAGDRGLGAAVVDSDVRDHLEGVAEGAGLAGEVLLAALYMPEVALGGCDAIAVSPRSGSPGVRGMVIGLGRAADPAIDRFVTDGVSGMLVGVKGLPGAVAGWNDAGLIVFLGRGERSSPAELRETRPAAVTVERLVRECRSLAEAERLAGGLAPIDRPLLVLHAAEPGVWQFDRAGRMQPPGDVFHECDPRAALARILLADGAVGEAEALATLLRGSAHDTTASALSAACTWLAIGTVDGEPRALAGSSLGGDWLPPGAIGTLPRSRPSVADDAAAVTRRYTLATRALSTPLAVRDMAGARVAIIGGGDVAARLAAALEGIGAEPLLVHAGDREQLCAALDRAEAGGPVRHLVVATPWSSGAGRWIGRRHEAVSGPYFACQRWVTLRGRAGDLAASTMTAVTNLGGDFGIRGAIGSVESGGLTGLFKGVAREFPDLQVRIADFAPAMAADDVASAVLAVIRDDAGVVEIGHLDGRRVTVVPVEGPPVANSAPRAALVQGSVWLVTGGARGVTAACARALATRYGLSLAVVGSTRPVAVEKAWLTADEVGIKALKARIMLEAKGRREDPRSAWRAVEKSLEIARSLAAYEAAGVKARYYACDLADAAAVRGLVDRVVAELGPVRGLVHGAGFEAACRFEKKTPEGFEATVGPKCIGLANVLDAVDPTTLERIVAFGSTSGRFGGHGQADYSLANDMLAKMVVEAGRRSAATRATAFHWHAWDEVGMASRPESRFVLEQFGLKFMPLAEGVRRFLDEIEAGQPDAEVVVTEPAMCPDAIARPDVPPAHAVKAPGLVSDVVREPGATHVSFTLKPSVDRFLVEHKLRGRPQLPAVMGAELLAQAFIASGAARNVAEIRDFRVERPIAFPSAAVRRVRVEVVPQGPGVAVARGWAAGPEGSAESVHLRGIVSSEVSAPVDALLDDQPFPFNPMVYQEDAPLWHGPAFRTLTGLFLDRSGGWARLTAPSPAEMAQPQDGLDWTVPAALLDGCLVGCAVYSYILCSRRVEVPVRFERFRIVGRPRTGEVCTARIHFRSQNPGQSVYDLVLFGSDGRHLLALDGLHLAVIDTGEERSR